MDIPGCPSKKNRGVTPASWPNSPTGLWPSWPPIYPHTLIGFITVSSPPVSWCVVGVLVSHHPGGCCTLVVDEEISPLLCKALWVPRKALYKCNKLLLIIIIKLRYFWLNLWALYDISGSTVTSWSYENAFCAKKTKITTLFKDFLFSWSVRCHSQEYMTQEKKKSMNKVRIFVFFVHKKVILVAS